MARRILLVEDDPLVAMMIEGYLEALGHETAASAESVAAALAQIAAGKFDAAILDVHLANGETSEPVAEALRAAGIGFVVATGDRQAMSPAFTGVPRLPKPFTIASLEAALDSLPRLALEPTQPAA